MLYDNAVEQAIAQTAKKEVTNTMVRLGTVAALDMGRAKVQFYGENTTSDKLYHYVDGYIPKVGDKIALISQGNTWIILGAIVNTTPEQKWADIDHNHDSEYLSKDYANKIEDGANNITLSGTSAVPNASKVISLGSSARQYKEVHSEKVFVNETEIKPNEIAVTNNNVVYKLSLSVSGTTASFLPGSSDSVQIGNATYKLKAVTAIKFVGKWSNGASSEKTLDFGAQNIVPSTTDVSLGDSTHGFNNLFCSYTNVKMRYNLGSLTSATFGFTSATALDPSTNKTVTLGDLTHQFKAVYGENIYTNGTAVTSDKRKKKGIKGLTKKYFDFFKRLRPVSFKYKDGTSDRTHTGFIAQEVEEAANLSGFETKEIATIVIQENGEYALRYNELIAVQTAVIQDLLKRVEALESTVYSLKGDMDK